MYIDINDVLAITRSDEIVTVNIPSDATTNEVIDILSDNGLVKQKTFCKVFYSAMDWFKNLNKTKKPGPPNYLSGVYYVQKNLGLEGYLPEFKEVRKSADTVSLAFPEGWTIYQMFERLDKWNILLPPIVVPFRFLPFFYCRYTPFRGKKSAPWQQTYPLAATTAKKGAVLPAEQE